MSFRTWLAWVGLAPCSRDLFLGSFVFLFSSLFLFNSNFLPHPSLQLPFPLPNYRGEKKGSPKMEPSKIYSIFLICMLFISSATPIFGCGSCGKPPPKKSKPGSGYKSPKGPIVLPPVIIKPPVTLPPIPIPPVKPPIDLPPIGKPPVTLPPIPIPPVKPPINLPPIVKPPVTLPPIPLPPVKPPIDLPPVSVPPVTVPPIITKPSPSTKPCPPSGKETCPIDTLKLSGCVNLLGGLVHIGVGDPIANECCPVLSGMAEMEAAICLCTTLKIKSLNLNIYVPIALQLLITCGKTPPPGYTCSL